MGIATAVARRGVLAVVVLALALSAGSARAEFIVDPDPGGLKLYIDQAKNASVLSGRVDDNQDGPVINIVTVGPVDTGNGYANFKPAKDNTLTWLKFTPVDPLLFGDFSFRGQLEDGANGTVKVTVADQNGDEQLFTFDGLGSGKDFDRIGIVSKPGSGQTIQWVSIESAFKEVKQVDFSYIPEPAFYQMAGLLALGGLGLLRRRKRS